MTDINSHFMLWPVGQGLFYTGKIQCRSSADSFQFMYDCGGSNEETISEAIDDYLNYFNPKKEIDMLVISHFDRDHINGLSYLLKEINKIKKIFIPYYGDFNSYLLLVAYIYGNGGNFSEKVDNIILVSTNRFEGEDGIATDLDELRLDSDIDEAYRIGNIRVSRVDLSSCVALKRVWKFKFYNVLLKKTTSIGKVKQDIDNLMEQYGSSKLEELLSNCWDDSVKKGLKRIYDSNVPENSVRNKFRNSSQNQASICLYHSPLIKNKYYEAIVIRSYSLFCYSRCFSHFCWKDSENIGTMLTGDISLRVNKKTQKYDHFRDFFSSEKDKVLFFLVPHHGSINNWNPAILNDFENVNFFLNSAGLDNDYGHPDGSVIKEILSKGSSFLWANENNLIEYEIHI